MRATFNYVTLDGLIHYTFWEERHEVTELGRLVHGPHTRWCSLRCDPDHPLLKHKGATDQPVTCLACLARHTTLHTADECDGCAEAMASCPCDTPRCHAGCSACCGDGH